MNFSVLDHRMRSGILECNLSMKKIKESCKKKYPEEGCFQVNQFTVAKKCPPGLIPVSHGYCVPKCPLGYEVITNDAFFCKKSIKSNRSIEFHETFRTNKKIFRNSFVYQCPKGFR